jgi:quercetin dioxygenase-like cupin family protein
MKGLVFLGLSALVVASPAVAKKARHHHATVKKAAAAKPAELKWMDGPPGLPAGATFAVKKGNPEKSGAFTIGIKMPAGYSVPPHWHPTDEHVTVVSGKVAYGMSDRMSRTAAQGLSAGGKVVMKAKEHHWVMTADGAEVEVSAMGPFKITYVNPADDPRGAAKPAAKPTK